MEIENWTRLLTAPYLRSSASIMSIGSLAGGDLSLYILPADIERLPIIMVLEKEAFVPSIVPSTVVLFLADRGTTGGSINFFLEGELLCFLCFFFIEMLVED